MDHSAIGDPGDTVPVGEQWLHEIKYGRYRILVHVKQKSAQRLSRNKRDWTGKLYRIAEGVSAGQSVYEMQRPAEKRAKEIVANLPT